MATIYHVRPMDLHAPREHCNAYDCSEVVMKHDYDEAVRLLREAYGLHNPWDSSLAYRSDLAYEVGNFLRAAEGKSDDR